MPEITGFIITNAGKIIETTVDGPPYPPVRRIPKPKNRMLYADSLQNALKKVRGENVVDSSDTMEFWIYYLVRGRDDKPPVYIENEQMAWSLVDRELR